MEIAASGRRGRRSAVWVFLLLSVGASPAATGAEESGAPPFRPLRVDRPPRIDGVLDEPFWSDAPVWGEFVQQLPEDRVPPSERTEVRLAYDADNLYLGVRLFDREPEKLNAWALPRDSPDLTGDDQLAFCIDPSNSGRDGFWFSTNPAGMQADSQVFDEGRIFDLQWDGVWEVETRTDAGGWTAEIRIPLFNLRFTEAPENVMGISFFRAIRRKNEEDYSPYIPRNYRGTISLSLARKMVLEGVHRGIRWQPKPYVLGRALRLGDPEPDTDREGRMGLDVLKWGVSSNLTADFTYRTDFAQVEADVQQVNLTRFNLFIPEKRDFFLESAGLFQFGTPEEVDVFFSRRIGLSDDGRPIPILAGGRLTGRAGGTSLGVLDVFTDEGGGEPRTNFGVVRIRQDILARSSVGMILTDREGQGPGGGNRVAGADTHVTFREDYNFDAFYAGSWSSPDSPEGSSSQVRFGKDSDIWQVAARYVQVDPGFDPGVGFVRRRDMDLADGILSWRPRPESDVVRQYALSYLPRYVTDRNGELQSRENLFQFETRFESGDWAGARYSDQFERVTAPFRIPDPVEGIEIPAGDYPMRQASVYVNTFPGREFFGGISGQFGTFFGGNKSTVLADLTAKFGPHFSLSTHYEYDHVLLPGGNFDVNLWITRLQGAVSPRLFGSALVQANDVDDTLDLNLRVDWIHHPGSDLFFVYNHSTRLRPNAGESTTIGREATVKITWLFSF